MEQINMKQQMDNFQQDLIDFNSENIRERFLSMYHEEETTQQGTKIHRCTYPDCGKIFKFKSEISRHIATHSSNRPFQCKHKGCNKTFRRLDTLDNHVRIHTKAMPFLCTLPGCDQKFHTQAGLRYHVLKHSEERSYKCPFPGCGKTYISASHLRQHQRLSAYHNKTNYEEGASPEERSSQTKSSTDLASSPFEHKDSEEDYISQESLINFGDSATVEGDFQKLLNRVVQENRKLEKRLELLNKYCDAESDMNESDTELHSSPNVFDSDFNQHDADLLIIEFCKGQE